MFTFKARKILKHNLAMFKKNVLSFLCLLVLGFGCKTKNKKIENKCNLKPDAGPCEAYIPKFYYDNDTGKCKEFIWGGCDGVVPFDTLEECEVCLVGKN